MEKSFDAFQAPPRLLLQRDYASFGRRLAAYLVDIIILLFVGAVPERLLGSLGQWFALALGVTYAIGFIAIGATPGMRIMKIHVIDNQFATPGLVRSAKRWLLPGLVALVFQVPFLLQNEGRSLDLNPLLSTAMVLAAVVGSLDVLWIFRDEQRRALHDIVADTLVIPDAVMAPSVPDFHG
jgi:uncharacterized RDD family membrane protein YckC